MYGYIYYNRRSCATGRALFEALKAARLGGLNWRHTTGNPRITSDVKWIIRWGNSTSPSIEGAKEINLAENIAMATDKLTMIRELAESPDVNIPAWVDYEDMMYLPQDTTWYVRDRNDHVEQRNYWVTGDKYATAEVHKAREFRVHIFENTTVGVYEKIPNDGVYDGKLLKDHNSTFRRVDMSSVPPELIGLRPIAKAAVKTLGLVHGGVDVVKDKEGTFKVLEVNSAPGLNDPNLERWLASFAGYMEEHSHSERIEPSEDLVARAEEERVSLVLEIVGRRMAVIEEELGVKVEIGNIKVLELTNQE